jgi:hypothetical protein
MKKEESELSDNTFPLTTKSAILNFESGYLSLQFLLLTLTVNFVILF